MGHKRPQKVEPFRDSTILQRDASGNIVFIPASSAARPFEHTQTGIKSSGIDGFILADDGTPFLVTKNLQDPTTNRGMDTNCHGYSLADGEFWVEPHIVGRLLEADGYKKVENPAPGDIVLYYDWERQERSHSAIIHSTIGPDMAKGLAGSESSPWIGTVEKLAGLKTHAPSNRVNLTYWSKRQ
jgi:hypothetical protein